MSDTSLTTEAGSNTLVGGEIGDDEFARMLSGSAAHIERPPTAPEGASASDPTVDPTAPPAEGDIWAAGEGGAGFADNSAGAVVQRIGGAADQGLQAIGAGALRAGGETYDFFFGNTADEDKTWLRREADEFAEEANVPTALVMGATQFAVGLLGAGKFLAATKLGAAGTALLGGGKVARIGGEIVKGGMAMGVAFDPHEARLSNLIHDYVPMLANPLTDYLRADPSDSTLEGRFKNAIEGAGLDALGLVIIGLGAKIIRARRAGDTATAEVAAKELAGTLDGAAAGAPKGSGGASGAGAKPRMRFNNQTQQWEAAPSQGATVGEAVQQFRRADDPTAPTQKPTAAGTPRPVEQVPVAPVKGGKGLKKGELKPVPEQKLRPIFQKIEGDVEALMTWGTREKAAFYSGHNFGGSDRIPWAQFNNDADLGIFIKRASDEYTEAFTTANTLGKAETLTDTKLLGFVKNRLRVFNEDPELVLGAIRAAGKDAGRMVADGETASILGMGMLSDAQKLHAKIRMGNLDDFGGDLGAAMAEFAKRTALGIQTLGDAASIVSNSARTLRRQGRNVKRLTSKELEAIKGMTTEQLGRLFDEAAGDVGTLKRLLTERPGVISQVVRGLVWLRAVNLLWGWKTHTVNFSMNAAQLVLRPAVRIVGATVGRSLGVISKSTASSLRVEAARQYIYMGASLHDSFRAAATAFNKGDSTLMPHVSSEHIQYASGPRAPGSTPLAIGEVMKGWGQVKNVHDLGRVALQSAEVLASGNIRMMGAVDEGMKMITYRSVVLSKASMEADSLGLRGSAARAHVERKLTEAFDENGQALDAQALYEAQKVTFQEPLLPKTTGSWLMAYKQSNPWFGFILPYVRTPINVFREGLKYTPGLNLLQQEYRSMLRGKQGAQQQAQAIGQMTLGTLFMGAAAFMVHGGRLTGSAPANPAASSALRNAGWQANSVVFPQEDGTVKYFQLDRFDPIALPFTVMADLMNIYHASNYEEDPRIGNIATALGMAIANQLRSRTYLLSLTQFMDALNDPAGRGDHFLAGIVGSMVPGSTMWRQLSGDPYMREVRSMTDALMQNTPGFSENLPVRRDAFGDPLTVRKGFTSTVEDDIVDQEMIRLGLDTGSSIAPPSPYLNSVDIRDIRLDDGRDAYDLYQQYSAQPDMASIPLKQQIAKLIDSDSYQNAPDGKIKGGRLWMINRVVDKYRDAARKRMQAEFPEFRAKLQEEQAKMAAAYARGEGTTPQQGMEQLNKLTNAFGLDMSTMIGGGN